MNSVVERLRKRAADERAIQANNKAVADARLTKELSDWKNGHANSVRAHAAVLARAETAERLLAETRGKALDEAAQIANGMIFSPISDGRVLDTPSDGAYYMAAKILRAIRALALKDTQPFAEARDDGWRTIDSAPKGQKVLVAYQNQLEKWRIVTACYHTQLPWSDDQWRDDDDESEYAPVGWYEESDSSETIYQTDQQPTHWRPFPPPPSALKDTQPLSGEKV